MRARYRASRAGAPSSDRWIIPYADFVTLLFACFAALYAATALDATNSHPQPLIEAAAPEPRPIRSQDDGTEQARTALERELADELSSNRLELIEDRRGLVLAIPEAFAFDAGRAEMSTPAESLMARVGGVLSALPNAVRVEGHTDDTPIRNARFASNWDLSTARASRVVAYFIVNAGIAPERLSAAGYSQYHPRAENATAEGRVRNRRVDIVILNNATAITEEPVRP